MLRRLKNTSMLEAMLKMPISIYPHMLADVTITDHRGYCIHQRDEGQSRGQSMAIHTVFMSILHVL